MTSLLNSLCEGILREDQFSNADPKSLSQLKAMNPLELTMTFLNWQSRLISSHPRNVHLSNEFCNSESRKQFTFELALLLDEIKNGKELTPRLSRGTKILFSTGEKNGHPKPLSASNRPDMDMLLNDWDVHHLHISDELDHDGFSKRGKYLLFVIFRHNDAYVIGLFHHKSWASKEVAEIIVRNWPQLDIFVGMDLVESSADGSAYSEAEQLAIRHAGMVNSILIDGRWYGPTSFISMAGYSMRIKQKSVRLLKEVSKIDENYDNFKTQMIEQALQHGFVFGDKIDFKFIFTPDGFGVEEIHSKIPIELHRW